MKGDAKSSGNKATRMELKYCEHCGGLWLRECGAGVVYCGNCEPKVADLPIPKKKPHHVTLPVRRRTAVDDYEIEADRGTPDLKASAGGAA
jgi:hypothetical protein